MHHQAFEGPRPPRLEERAPLLTMINEIFRVSRGLPPTIGNDWAHVYAPENLANVAVIYARDAPDIGAEGSAPSRPVASTGVWANDVLVEGTQLRVGGINCVGTLADYRRFGLGTQTMAAAHATLRRLGCHVGLLSTGIANWYRRMGWEEAGQLRTYRLNRGNTGLLPELPTGLAMRVVTVDEALAGDPATLDAILRLGARAALGGIRTLAVLQQFLAARRVEQVAVVEGADGAHAYALVRGHAVIEWAGDAVVVAGMARALFSHLDDPDASTSARNEHGPVALRAMHLQTPGWQHPLVKLLDNLRLPCQSDYLGMLYLVEPQAVLDAYGVTQVRVVEVEPSDDGGRWRVEAGAATLELHRRRLTKLFFGPERVSDQFGQIFPLPFWQWSVEHV